MLWTNEISWDLSLKCVSDGFPILHSPQSLTHTTRTWCVLLWFIIPRFYRDYFTCNTNEAVQTNVSIMMTSSNRNFFPRYWPFVRGIHRSPANSPHKGQRREALMFSLICAWTNGWVNNHEAGDLRRCRAHDDVIVMCNSCEYIRNYTTNNARQNKACDIGKSMILCWQLSDSLHVFNKPGCCCLQSCKVSALTTRAIRSKRTS